MNAAAISERTNELLVRFNMTTAAAQMVNRLEQAGHQHSLSIVLEVLEMEAEARQQRKISRLRRPSLLAPGKTFDTLELGVFQPTLVRKLRELARGEFLENAANLLAFGPPGVGKSHAASALGHALIEQGHAVLFRPVGTGPSTHLSSVTKPSIPRLSRDRSWAQAVGDRVIAYVNELPDRSDLTPHGQQAQSRQSPCSSRRPIWRG